MQYVVQHRPPPEDTEHPEWHKQHSLSAQMVCPHICYPKVVQVYATHEIEVLTVVRRVYIHYCQRDRSNNGVDSGASIICSQPDSQNPNRIMWSEPGCKQIKRQN